MLYTEEECCGKGNRIYSMSVMSGLASAVRCPDCFSPLKLCEGVRNRRGIVTKQWFECQSKRCTWQYTISDPYTPESKGLNCKSVFGSRLMGKGRTGIETVTAVLDLPPPVTDNSYSDHNEFICEVVGRVAREKQREAVSRLRQLYNANPDDILDVTVTVDGTWSKRGFTAPYGVVAVISWVTGEVINAKLLSKYCAKCSSYKGPQEGPEYEEWLNGHKSQCTKNHTGSSPSMEIAGARILFARLISEYNLRYKTVISDGDTKTVSTLNAEKVYGDVDIVKHECVGHVQKRVVTNLKRLKTRMAALMRDAKSQEAETKKALNDERLKLVSLLEKDGEADQMVPRRGSRGGPRGTARPQRGSRGASRGRPQGAARGASRGAARGRPRGAARCGRGGSRGGPSDASFEEPSNSDSPEIAEVKMAVSSARVAHESALANLKRVPNFRGRFRDNVEMIKLQKYYGRNIRANVGNLERMKCDCLAAFYHSCSTDDNPQHHLCPDGPDSWCWYVKAKLSGGSLIHKYPLIPPDLAPCIEEEWL